MIVGDDDQSIYGWRGAQVENIQRFLNDFPGAETIRLEQNYRSTSNILSAANALIENNNGRLGKKLWTDGADGEPISLYCAFNDLDEARFVVNRIKTWQENGGALEQCAILYRSNAQSRVLEEALLQASMPYRIYGGMRFFERQEIKDALSYLRLIANRNDDAAFERVVNTPTRGIGDRTLDVVRQTSRDRQLTLWQASRELLKEKALAGRAASALQRFMELIDALAQETTDMPLHVQTDRVIKDSGLRAMYEQEKGEKGQTRIENLEELVTATRQFSYNEEDEDLMPLQAFFPRRAGSGRGAGGHRRTRFSWMTLHSAKGLEFPQVFIVGVEEGMFPSQMALDEGGRTEEERRGLRRRNARHAEADADLCGNPPSVRERGLSPPVALYRRAAAGVRRRSASASHGEPPGKPSATGRADCRERYRLQVRPARTASEVWRRHYCQPRRQRRAQPTAGGFSGPWNQMAGGGLRPAGGSVTLRKISLFCNILLPLYVKAPDLRFRVPLRVDADFALA